MKIIKKIIMIIMILIVMLMPRTYSKYNYTYNLNAFTLTRDDSEIIYNITRTEEDKLYTNKDVLLSIYLNKPINKIEGFNISEDGKILTKIIKENESNTIKVEDNSGNSKDIAYTINNIDKIPPEIVGIEDGMTYNTNKNISYTDNIGIKDIFVDRYSKLNVAIYPDYYDTSFYKGIDITSDKIIVNLTGKPKNTSFYKYYLNGNLKATTKEKTYTYSGLLAGTNYQIKVEALDENNNVLESISKNVITKYFKEIKTEKTGNTFKVTVYGIDPKIQKAIAIGFTNDNNKKYFYPIINSDRSLTMTFLASDITNSLLENSYYYFHIQLFDNQNYTYLYETICCNVIFNTNYIKKEETEINPYNLTQNGNYEITVVDLAGNKTIKNITINK